MIDIGHLMGSDLTLNSSGDLAVVANDEAVRERVLRRLLTNQGAYIWQLSYGGGLSSFVGQISNTGLLLATVRSQLMLESSVARQPLPSVAVSTVDPGVTIANITYFSASTKSPQMSSMTLGAS